MTPSIVRNLLTLLLVTAAIPAARGESIPSSDAQLPLGVVAEKPQSGPAVKIDGGYMVPYTANIPGTDIEFRMLPIPGGSFVMGSDPSDPQHREDEGPTRTIEVAPFWMAEHEVTWREYKTFMSLYRVFKALQSEGIRPVTDENRVDAISVPTPLYEPAYTYEFGEDPMQPAVTMTQYSAKQYSKWLAGMSKLQYRLPTEAEWEYACRGGSSTAYSFGDDPSQLDEYAAYAGNSGEAPHVVKSFKPNPYGLYDMHGNAWEWTIDGYREEGYPAEQAGKTLSVWEAVVWPTEASFRTVRGGGFQDDPENLRSASRMASIDEDWKASDPNWPLSPWWFTDDPARSVGMRLVRSLTPLDAETIDHFWNETNEDIVMDVEARLEERRGVLGLPVPELADDIRAARE